VYQTSGQFIQLLRSGIANDFQMSDGGLKTPLTQNNQSHLSLQNLLNTASYPDRGRVYAVICHQNVPILLPEIFMHRVVYTMPYADIAMQTPSNPQYCNINSFDPDSEQR
jgi:hypothetical protein